MTSVSIRSVLIFSPRFAPANAADAHRARLLANHLLNSGLNVCVLSADPASLPNETDDWQRQQIQPGVRVVYVAVRKSLFGLHSLFLRTFVPFWRVGSALIKAENVDVVYFSSTEFPLAFLLPVWRRSLGVRCVMDFQDPWVNDYYRRNPEVMPPGGRFKYFLASSLNRILEPIVYRSLSAVMAVSPQYLIDLADRYDNGKLLLPHLVNGFPAEPAEFESLGFVSLISDNLSQPVWRYIGRGGEDMLLAVGAFFSAWARERRCLSKSSVADVSLEMIGTSYAAAGRAQSSFDSLAHKFNLETCFTESPVRIPYSETLRKLKSSSALVVFGSDDPSYTASKIYPYLLAKRPLLAIFHEKSSVVKLISHVGGAILVTFNSQTTEAELARAIHSAWFVDRQFERTVPLNMKEFEPYTARFQAGQLVDLFERALAYERDGGRAIDKQ